MIGRPLGSDAVIEELRRLVAYYGSQKETARVLCVSESYLCDLLKERRPVTRGLADILGFDHVQSFVKRA